MNFSTKILFMHCMHQQPPNINSSGNGAQNKVDDKKNQAIKKVAAIAITILVIVGVIGLVFGLKAKKDSQKDTDGKEPKKPKHKK